jgi:hypothetical protein
MKSPLAIVLLLLALIAPVAVFLLLASRFGMNGWIAAIVAVAAGWALNVAWAFAVEKADAQGSPEPRGNTLSVAKRFGWACPAVLIPLAWFVCGMAWASPAKDAGHDQDLQVMVGPAFEPLFDLADRACPAARMRYAKPAELLDDEDLFIDSLPDADKARVASNAPRDAGGGYVACAGRDGASCSAAAALRAIDAAGLTREFVDSTCRKNGRKPA